MAEKKRKWSKEARERLKQKYKDQEAAKQDLMYKKPEVDERILKVSEMREEEYYISKRDFVYDTGINFQIGEVVKLRGLPNDEKLVRLGYVVPFRLDGTEGECIQCGKKYGSTSGYNRHVALHYNKCSICKKDIAPDQVQKHAEAHQLLSA